MTDLQQVEAYCQTHSERFEKELVELLRFPSVSANSDNRADIEGCANWLADHLRAMGLESSILPTPRWPVVFAQSERRGDRPTVVIYGHYDVQPAEPLELWQSPPFEPRIAGGNIYARGATDDKGQLFTHLKAVEAWLQTTGELPVNVIFLLEGEEEIGSPHLEEFIQQHRDLFQADAAIVSDTSQFGPRQPALCYGLRGICYLEFVVEGAREDLHSGMYGGIAPNPCQVVTNILAEMKSLDGRVLIPGFYDDMEEVQPWEQAAFEALPWDYGALAEELGLSELAGEQDYSIPVRKWARPTLDINGLYGGYAGEGTKTIIPNRAGAKFSMRLVPGQDPQRIVKLCREFITARIPSCCRVTIYDHQASAATIISLEDPAMQAALQALEYGFEVKPHLIREGASIPIVDFFVKQMNWPTALLGYGLPDDNLHAPNEKLNLADFHRGIRTTAGFFEFYREKKQSR